MFFTTPISGSVRPVDLTVSSVSVSGGNGNGAVDPNECNQINVVIQNSGETIAYDVTAELTTEAAGVSIIQPLSKYPDLEPGSAGRNAMPFWIGTSPSFVCG